MAPNVPSEDILSAMNHAAIIAAAERSDPSGVFSRLWVEAFVDIDCNLEFLQRLAAHLLKEQSINMAVVSDMFHTSGVSLESRGLVQIEDKVLHFLRAPLAAEMLR